MPTCLSRRSNRVPARLLPVVSMVFGLTACTGVGPSATNESLSWTPAGFVLAYQEKTGWKDVRGRETLRRIYAKPGATAENWTEKAEVTELPIAITLGGKFRWDPVSVMNAEKARMEKLRCSTHGWTVLNQETSSILWEWPQIDCPAYLHQHGLVRVVMGRWSLWMISYGIRNRALSDDERAGLIRDLMSAKVDSASH